MGSSFRYLGTGLLALFLTLAPVAPTLTNAAPSRQLPFSATLRSASTLEPVPDGLYNVTFRIYGSETGGAALWSEMQSLRIGRGAVSAYLGSVTALPASLTFDSGMYYLGVQVGDDPEMSPRKRIGSVPQALNADTVDGAHAGTTAGSVLLLDQSGNIAIQGGASFGQGLSVGGSIVPTTAGLTLGSSTNHFAAIYVDSITAGSTTISGTETDAFTINTAQPTDNTETAALRFYLGPTLNTYAALQWNGPANRFDLLSRQDTGTSASLKLLSLVTATEAVLTLPAATDTLVGRTSTDTLSNKTLVDPAVSGSLAVSGAATVDSLSTAANVTVGGELTVTGATTLAGLAVSGNSSLSGTLAVSGDFSIAGRVTVTAASGNTGIAGTLSVTQGTALATLSTSGKATLESVEVTNGTTLQGALTVAGTATLQGSISVASNTTLGASSAQTLTVNARVASAIIPGADAVYDLGSPVLRFRNFYAANAVFDSLSTTNTTSPSFVINAGNTTADTQDSTLEFSRGTVSPNAILMWDAAVQRFDLNQALLVQGGVTLGSGAGSAHTIRGSVSLADSAPAAPLLLGTDVSLWREGVSTLASNADLLLMPVAAATSGTTTQNSRSVLLRGSYWNGTAATDVTGGMQLLVQGTSPSYGLALQTAGVTRMYVAENGNVGIGTTGPSEKLSVMGKIRANNGSRLYIDANANNVTISAADAKPFLFQNGSSTTMTLTEAGLLGIGTVAPTSPLHVKPANNGAYVTLTNNNGYGILTLGDQAGFGDALLNAVSGDMRLQVAGVDALRVQTATGRVGIGVANPTEKLAVSGNITTTGFVNADSYLYTSGSVYGVVSYNNAYRPRQAGLPVNIQNHSGTSLMTALDGGNIGIGTTTPKWGVQVQNGHIVLQPSLTQNSDFDSTTDAQNLGIGWRSMNGNTIAGLINATSNGDYGADITFLTRGSGGGNMSEKMRLTTVGKLGIGTTAPASSLHIESGDVRVSTGGKFYFETVGTDNALYRQVLDGSSVLTSPLDILFGSGGLASTYMTIKSGGNVGIGISNPGVKLDVSGNIRASSTIYSGLFSNGTGESLGLNLSSHYLTLSTNSNEAVRIDSSGNVGIGTSSPSERLQIAGGSIVLDNAQSFKFKDSGGAATSVLTVTAANNVQLNNTLSNGSLQLQNVNDVGAIQLRTGAGNAERMRIDAAGNVGIGTSSPSYTLDVNGAINSGTGTLRLQGNGVLSWSGIGNALVVGAPASEKLYLQTSATTRLTVDSGGNVGIGTATPSNLLTVAGGLESTPLKVNYSSNNGSFSGTATLLLSNSNGGLSKGTSILFQAGSRSTARIRAYETANNYGDLGFGTTTNGTENEVLRITSAGIVGIGITNPSLGRLQVAQVADTNADGITLQNAASGATSRIWMDASGFLRLDAAGTANGNIALNGAGIGNVGIGTLSPRNRLEIVDASLSSTTSVLGIGASANSFDGTTAGYFSGSASGTQLAINAATGFAGNLVDLQVGGVTKFRVDATGSGLFYNATTIFGRLGVSTNSNSYFSGNGLLGIGTESPSYKVHIQSADTQGLGVVSTIAPSATGGAGIQGLVSQIPTAADQRIGFYTLGALNGSGGNNSLAIQGFSSEAWTLGAAQGSYMTFSTTPNASGARVERMRIDPDGNIGIGTPSPVAPLEVKKTNGYQLRLTSQSSYALMGVANDGPLLLSRTGGASDFNITSAGNVGIGTNSPLYPLQVAGANYYGVIANGAYQSYTNDNNQRIYLGQSSSAGLLWLKDTTGTTTIDIRANGATYLNGGNVGIGTATPLAKLHVYTNSGDVSALLDSPSNSYIYFEDSGTAEWHLGRVDSDNRFAVVESGAGERLTIKSGGNVGIGTASPGETLDVNGTARATALRVSASANLVAGTFGIDGTNLSLNTSGAAYGINMEPTNTGSGPVYGVYGTARTSYAGSVTALTGGSFGVRTLNAASSVSSAVAIQAASPVITAGNVSTSYGLNIATQKVVGVTTGYGLYQSGAFDLNYFAGNVGIGTTNPGYKLDVNGTAGIATSLAVPTIFTPAATNLSLQSTTGIVALNTSNTQNKLRVFAADNTNYIELTHTGTAGQITSTTGELQLGGNGTTDVYIGDVGSPSNLVFEESSTISGQGANTITLGTAGDIFDLSSANVVYRFGTLTAPSGVTIASSSDALTGLTVNTPTGMAGNLLDLQVNGVSKYSVSASGAVSSAGMTVGSGQLLIPVGSQATPGLAFSGYANTGFYYDTANSGFAISQAGSRKMLFANSLFQLTDTNAGITLGAGSDARIYRDGSGVVALRNGTNAHTLRVYNTYTDGSNYERLSVGPVGNVMTFASEAVGTGTARNFNFSGGNVGIGTTAPAVPLDIRAASGGQSALRLATNDMTTGVGSILSMTFGASSGDTASRLQAYIQGGGAVGSLILNPNGGNTGIGNSSPTGLLHVGSGSGVSGYALNVTPSGQTAGQTAFFQDATASTGVTRVVMKSGANQTGSNLLELQNNSGGILARFSSNGDLGTDTIFNRNSGSNSQLRFTDTGLQGTTALAANVALTVNNTNATPTANLLVVQANSVSKLTVDPSGNMWLAGSLTVGTVTSQGSLSFTTASNGDMVFQPNGTGAIKLIAGSGGVKIGDGGTTNYAKFDSNGSLSFAGAARPYSEITLLPSDAVLPSTGGCTLATTDDTNHSFKTLDCASAADQWANWQFKLPATYQNGTNVQVDVYWTDTASTTTTDGPRFDVGYVSVANAEDWVGATRTDVTGAVVNSSGQNKVTTSTVTLTAPSMNANDLVSLRVLRKGTVDTLADTVKVIEVRVRFLVGG